MSIFLQKKKAKSRPRVASDAPRLGAGPSSTPVQPNGSNGPSPASGAASDHAASPASAPTMSENIVEIKLFSTGDMGGLRYNMMKMHSEVEVDPRDIPSPILFNRKPRGEPSRPIVAYDAQGKAIGKYVYDKDGKPVMDAEGLQVVEMSNGPDLSLVGGAEKGQKRRKGKTIRDVYTTDVEAIKLKREESEPWVLESGRLQDGDNDVKMVGGSSGVKQEQGVSRASRSRRWVGSYLEPTSMGTILMVGNEDGSFGVIPLGRTYRFNADRPFKTGDSDAANKEFEYQVRHKIYDRWAHRPADSSASTAGAVRPHDDHAYMNQELRAQRWDMRSRIANGEDVKPKIKVERFDDDMRREGRRLERGMEGGEDEDLDYDVNEDFQDDEDNNTFHRNEEEEEEQKRIDVSRLIAPMLAKTDEQEQMRKEYKMANANVGDRPQIDSGDESDDDLFGDKLTSEGKKLRKIMRKGGDRDDDMFGSDEESEDSDAETVKSEKSVDKRKDDKSVPGSAERPTRPPSRGPGGVPRAGSPSGRRPHAMSSNKAQTAPPGTGAAFLAQRAASGLASPRRRSGSPANRAQSPDAGSTRAGSPASRGGSPGPGREGSPGVSQSQSRNLSQKKRKTPSHSPLPSDEAASTSTTPDGSTAASNKRKTSPAGPNPSGDVSRKKKKSSSATPTPGPPEDFPGMITRDEVVDWFRRYPQDTVLMSDVINAFRPRLATNPKNQGIFLRYVKEVTESGPAKTLKILRERF